MDTGFAPRWLQIVSATRTDHFDLVELAAEALTRELTPEALVRQGLAPAGDLPTRFWTTWSELGWLAMGLDQDAGGLQDVVGQMLVARELGRHLAPGPLLPTMVAAAMSVRSGAHSLGAELGEGRRRAGFLLGDTVVDAVEADLALAVDGAEARLWTLDGAEPKVGVDPLGTVARARLGKILAAEAGTAARDHFRLLSAAALVGIAEAVTVESSRYATERIQFGHPIGSFQAVKHRCADMLIRAHAANSQTLLAAHAMAGGRDDARLHIASAVLLATRAARLNTADNIQNHGAIGFSAEHTAHLYLKRALVIETCLGGAVSADVLAPERVATQGKT